MQRAGVLFKITDFDTDDLAEGAVNLYHSPFDVWNAGVPWAINTTYQAAEDIVVHAYRNAAPDLNYFLEGKTDAGTPPAVVRQRTGGGSYTEYNSITMSVKKDHYWRVECAEATTIFIIPQHDL